MEIETTPQLHRARTEHIVKDLQKKMVFVVGPRQVGKTWLTKHIGERFSRVTYLNYDNPRDRETIRQQAWARDIDLLILDELHKMPLWKNFIKGVYDTKPKTLRVLVTGSARLESHRHMGDSLAGRYFVHHLMPFSLAELRQQSAPKEYIDIDRLLARGGFPEPFLTTEETDASRWRELYIDSLTRGDVFEIENIHNLRALNAVFELLRHRVGSPISYAGIARDINASPTTVKKYVEVLEALYVIFLLRPHTNKIARSILKEPKIYFFDTGLVKGDSGARFENLVAVSLQKHVLQQRDLLGSGTKLAYLRDKEKREVDFVLTDNENEPTLLIEAKYADSTPASSLVHFSEKYDIPGIQLVRHLDHERQVGQHIEIRNATDYLTQLH